MKLEILTKLFDTFYQRTYIPICIIDKSHQLLFPSYSPLYLHIQDFPYLLKQDKYPVHVINTYQSLLASFSYENFIILIGPCLLLGASQEKPDYFSQFQTYISTESLDNFIKAISMLYIFLTHQDIDDKQIPIEYLRINPQAMSSQEIFEKNVYDRRIEDTTRDSYQFELRFLDYVKRGRKDKIDWIFTQFNKTYIVSLAESSLDTVKIKFISIVTLMTRMVLNEGVPLESAFGLSDALIQNLPHIRNVQECIQYIKYASYEYIKLIQSNAKKCSTLINQCVSYIDTHLYEKVTLQDLEDLTNHSSVYISSRFKKELGISFTQYLLERKIEEAKHLLLFTDHSFQEISTLLNFTSQSHFTQRFKQVTNQTPKEFRQKNFQYL
ncbi:AraC family transcriptional regulator [Longibaculum muris]|uniref:AraC family transcriptional regulator n=1 Tax=Longibaculum muris TaxID=1796628 RepID=UPI0022E51F02|nr:AraC family transcriptional regulator [Longibaculum muris]